MQRDAGVPAVLVSVLEALLVLLILGGAWLRSSGWLRVPRVTATELAATDG
jgi:hypothetical protein